MNDRKPLTPTEVIEEFPFPIAFDLEELLAVHEKPRAWREKVLRLRDLFHTILRFTSIVALGELQQKQKKSREEDVEISKLLHRLLVSPTLDDYLQILKLSMRSFSHAIDELVVPELYAFCFTPDGEETTNLQDLARILSYEKRVKRLGTAGEESEYNDLYQSYGGDNYAGTLWDLLRELRFFTDYQLLRLVDSRQKDDVFLWSIKVLQGTAIDPPLQQWEQVAPLREGVLAMWDPRKFNILYLPPYAIFYECDVCKQDGLVPAESVFLYERWEQDEAIYIGLRNSPLGLVHHIHTHDKKIVEELLRTLGLTEGKAGVDQETPKQQHLDWPFAASIAKKRSEGQVDQFQRIKKYSPDLYLNRTALEEQFQSFLAGPSAGFLLVGDPGMGKTNLLCHLTKSLLESDQHDSQSGIEVTPRNIVLLYNCSDFADNVDVAKEIARSLGRETRPGERPIESLTQILNTLEDSRPQDAQFIILFDAINEYRKPKDLMASINDFVTLVSRPWLRIVLSCRSESWKILSRVLKVGDQFYTSPEGNKENIILRFSDEELPKAYDLYLRKYELQTPFDRLLLQARKFIADPLRLSFVAESFQGKSVPSDLRSRIVLQKYKEAKIGDPDDRNLDEMEKTLVARIVDVMFESRVDQLRIKELWDDPIVGNWIRDREMGSPYMRLIDKGVLQETGPRDNLQQQLSKIKFTYERFFEYLLANKVYQDPNPAQVVDLIAHATQYPSLWGAVKIALIMDAEEVSLSPKSIFAKLVQEDRFDVRGMMVDALVTYANEKPQEVTKFCQWLLSTNNDAAGTVAIMTAYNFGSKEILLSAIRHRTASIRQTGAQFVYFFWNRDREQGNRLLQDFVNGISQDFNRSIPGIILDMARGKELDMQALPAVQSFMDMSIFLAAHLIRNPGALSQAARLWSHLLANVPGGERGKAILAQKMREQGAKVFIEGYKAGGAMNYSTMGEFFTLPLDDPQRELCRKYTQYMKIAKRQEIQTIEDGLWEMASIPSAVLSTISSGILMNYLMSRQDGALQFVEKVIGNEEPFPFRRFNGLRGLAYSVVMMPDPPQSYVDLLCRSVLNTWNDISAQITLAGQSFSGTQVVHMYPALAVTSRSGSEALQEFVDQLCENAPHLAENERIDTIIEQLAETATLLEPAEMNPVFDILTKSFDTEEHRDALAKAFADLWRKQSDRVDSVLSDPDIPTHLIVATRERIEQLKENQARFGFGVASLTSLMFIPPVQESIINTLTTITINATDPETGLGSVGSTCFDPQNVKAVSDWLP